MLETSKTASEFLTKILTKILVKISKLLSPGLYKVCGVTQ